MTVNIIKHDDILFYTFDTQAVNQLSPYTEFRLPPSSGTRVEHIFLHSVHDFLSIHDF